MDLEKQFYAQVLPNSTIKKLTTKDFSNCGDTILKENCVIFFYAFACRGCKDFAYEYSKFANYANKYNITPIACNVSENRDLVKMSNNFPYNLSAFPLVVIYNKGSPCTVYSGERTANSLSRTVAASLGLSSYCSINSRGC